MFSNTIYYITLLTHVQILISEPPHENTPRSPVFFFLRNKLKIIIIIKHNKEFSVCYY